MKKSLFVLSLTSLLALTGCHGLKKVNFDEFKSGVKEAEKAPEYKAVKITGKVDGKKVNFTYEFPKSWGGLLDSALDALGDKYNEAEKAAAGYMTSNSISWYTASENEDYTYYVSYGYKVKGKDFTVEWDKYANFASYKDDKVTVNAKWVKA